MTAFPGNLHLIPPGGFLVVWADSEPSQNSTNQPELHVNFRLSKEGEFIGLFAPDGTAVSAVAFGLQSESVSQGHFPDGTGPLVFMPTPTPGAPNTAPNTPPSLTPIADRFLYTGQSLQFVATAGDGDFPTQSLWFSIDAGLPAGPSINPTTGFFSWTPQPATLPATNPVTIRVTDNGNPPLSDAKTFSVFVFPPPTLAGACSAGDDLVSLSFSSLPGRTYQLEFKNNLDDSFWAPLGNPVSGTGGLLLMSDEKGQSRRFYRLTLLP